MTANELIHQPVPTTFAEYLQWIRNYKEVYSRETRRTRHVRAEAIHNRNEIREWRKQNNAKPGEMPPASWFGGYVAPYETSTRAERRRLCEMRRERKALGCALFMAHLAERQKQAA